MSQAPERPSERSTALIALGANAPSRHGAPEETIKAALGALQTRFGSGFVASRRYRTPCFPVGAGPDFVNAACRFETSDAPGAILDALHQLEAAFGRERIVRWGQRTLDLDLIAVGDAILPDEPTQSYWRNLPAEDQERTAPDRLILPHPRVQDRSFVLIPLAEIAADFRHPVLGLTVAQMRDRRPAAEWDQVKPI